MPPEIIPPDSLPELIDQITQRWGLYLGEKSVTRLKAFLGGWAVGSKAGIEQTQSLSAFDLHVHDLYQDSRSVSFETILLERHQSESVAFDEFVTLWRSWRSRQTA